MPKRSERARSASLGAKRRRARHLDLVPSEQVPGSEHAKEAEGRLWRATQDDVGVEGRVEEVVGVELG